MICMCTAIGEIPILGFEIPEILTDKAFNPARFQIFKSIKMSIITLWITIGCVK